MSLIKLTVEKADETMKFGFTYNLFYVYENINKIPTLQKSLQDAMSDSLDEEEIIIIIPFFNFISRIFLSKDGKHGSIHFFNPENDEDKAYELLSFFKEYNADEDFKIQFMEAFYELKEYYDEVDGVAVLSFPVVDN